MKSGRTAQECLKNANELLPIQCQHLITAFTDCKKGMVSLVFIFPLTDIELYHVVGLMQPEPETDLGNGELANGKQGIEN